LRVTNSATQTLINDLYLQEKHYHDSSFKQIIENFYNKGIICPILNYMESTGLYKANKPEIFNLQNELTPQAIFVALLNVNKPRTEFEQPIFKNRKPIYWIDSLSLDADLINIVEWKNVQIDYLYIPGIPLLMHLSLMF